MTFPDATALCRMCMFGPHRHKLVYYDGWATVMCSHDQISDLNHRVVRDALAKLPQNALTPTEPTL